MLARKMWRDLLKSKAQFISIFLMSMFGMMVFVGIDAESAGGARAANKYYKQYNLCDVWIQGAGFTDDDVRTAKKVPGVENVEKRLALTGTAEKYNNAYMYINFMNQNEINSMMLYEGDPFDEDEEGVWLEEWFARTNNIKIGDTFTLKIDASTIDAPVKGLVDAPDYVYFVSEEDVMYPNYQKCGLAYLPSSMFPDATHIIYNQLLVDVREDMSDDDSIDTIKQQLEKAFDRDDIAVTDRHQNLSYATFDSEIKQHQAMGLIFAGIALAIALLGIVTTMARVTASQRTIIGTMKALGFSKMRITFHYVSYGFVISAMGCVVGAWLGYIILPAWILGMFVGAYLIPDLKGVISLLDVEAVVGSVAISTLVSFLSCRKELKDPPAVTLRPPAPGKIRHSALEKSKLWLRLDFATQWNIRDIFRNKLRSLMGIMGVVGCAMLLVCGFGTFDSINGLVDKIYGELMTANNKVMLSADAGYDYAYDLKTKYKGQLIQETSVEFVSDKVKKSGSATIVDKGNYIHIQDENLKPVNLDKTGIAMTQKMADLLKIKKGDFVKWHIVGDDEWQYSRIVQIYRDPSVQGICMTRKVYEDLEYDFVPTSILTNMSLPDDITDEDEVSAVLNVAGMKDSFNETMEMMNSIVYVMIGAAVILGLVVLYNLGVLSFVEKTREVATLKVLGFRSGRIRNILQKQNIWLTVVGIGFGLYAGWGILYIICRTVSETLDMYPVVSLMSYLYSVGGTFLVSIFVNFMFSGKVKTIDMVDALKGVE